MDLKSTWLKNHQLQNLHGHNCLIVWIVHLKPWDWLLERRCEPHWASRHECQALWQVPVEFFFNNLEKPMDLCIYTVYMIHNLHVHHVYSNFMLFHDISWYFMKPEGSKFKMRYWLPATTWRVWAMGYANGASSSSLSSSVVQSSRAPNAGALPHQLTNVTRKYKKHQELHGKAQFQGFAVTLHVSQEETLYPLLDLKDSIK